MKTIALIAHNSRKTDLLNWAKVHREALLKYKLIGTSNTSKLLSEMLDIEVKGFGHGPSGGDILLAAKILQGEVHMIIFFIDAETPHGHEHDIQTLIRTAVINNIPIALNRASADLLILDERDQEE
ncbi:methylglyoxal synthase [Salinimicrobium profundisediminis]|jgi:methylglyoxal synthase|uniref:Methylglyoxal synthase n=1 Tax=Salinimicrobium profundisediminis TaxID=2994553 RepID=A0A9X3I1N8_9FLAO|nr:methylglyoxal synthase [Salinimicrobium profundisediminis]MCX2839270.1 methylglyoxal synthase [Salinimicrobium profundisediminis]